MNVAWAEWWRREERRGRSAEESKNYLPWGIRKPRCVRFGSVSSVCCNLNQRDMDSCRLPKLNLARCQELSGKLVLLFDEPKAERYVLFVGVRMMGPRCLGLRLGWQIMVRHVACVATRSGRCRGRPPKKICKMAN